MFTLFFCCCYSFLDKYKYTKGPKYGIKTIVACAVTCFRGSRAIVRGLKGKPSRN